MQKSKAGVQKEYCVDVKISNLDGWVEGEGKFNYLICIRIVLQKYMYICMHAE